ncbi:MAG: DGQHR domain-containing protein [Gammaproteobacteria bacterium]|nr:DGQHR domain-containing protein [Gammaproteobacteria bacterium]
MLNLYPALRARMGTWDYYVVKMEMKDVVKEVGFASEIYDNKTLDDAIQRTLNENRVKKEIVEYLGHRDDRFFSSIVVAALGGNPKFWPVDLADDPKLEMFKSTGFGDAFGVLSFDGGQRYFALDGQHRLKSIKTLIEQKEDKLPEVPEGFIHEEISVIMLVRREEDEVEFLRSYRRIFSSLNRYAKPTDADTNIIMDEDDAIAILTRRLLTEHRFFMWHGGANPKLKTKGKNLRSGDPFFTTLQTLYAINETLLTTPTRETDGFCTRAYKQFRPSEDALDELFDELVVYWDALLEEVDVLCRNPVEMREHNPHGAAEAESEEDDEESASAMDHFLFWPIGQEMFANVVRILLNRRLPDPEHPTVADVRTCVAPLAVVDWELHNPPWAGLVLVKDLAKDRWTIRNEDRKQAVETGKRIVQMQVGIDELTNADEADLKAEWHSMLIPQPGKSRVDEDWEVVKRVAGVA